MMMSVIIVWTERAGVERGQDEVQDAMLDLSNIRILVSPGDNSLKLERQG